MFFKKKTTKERVCVQYEKSEKRKSSKFSLVPKSRTTIGILSMAAALLIVFVGMPLAEKMSFRTVNVAVLTTDVSVGQLISENNFKICEMAAKNLPKNYISNSSGIVGRYAAMPMISGEIVVNDKISANVPGENPYLRELPEGQVAISVNINSFAGSLSGKLRQGDIIQIFSVSNESTEAIADNDLNALIVLAVTNSEAEDLSDGIATDDKKIATVTVLANEEQAKKLAALGTNSTLYAALVRRGGEATEQHNNVQGGSENESKDDSFMGE